MLRGGSVTPMEPCEACPLSSEVAFCVLRLSCYLHSPSVFSSTSLILSTISTSSISGLTHITSSA
jgi:hypothetical protein